MLSVVIIRPEEAGRQYRLPLAHDYKAVWKAKQKLNKIINDWELTGNKGLCPVPDESICLNTDFRTTEIDKKTHHSSNGQTLGYHGFVAI